MPTFRLLQLSDLHHGARPNESMVSGAVKKYIAGDPAASYFATHDDLVANLLRANANELCAAADPPIDLVLFTGDLATTGERPDLDSARQYIDNFFFHDFAHGTPEIFLLPGNHERYGANVQPVGTNFEATFPQYWPEYYRSKRTAAGITITKHDNSNAPHALTLLAFDLSLQEDRLKELATTKKLGVGRYLVNSHRAEMIKTTEQVRAAHPKSVIVWIIHFPPAGQVDKKFMLQDYQLVVELANELSVRMVISGHTHKPAIYRDASGLEVWVGGSACQYGEKQGHWFHVIEIKTTAATMRQAHRYNYSYKKSNGRFSFQPMIDVFGSETQLSSDGLSQSRSGSRERGRFDRKL